MKSIAVNIYDHKIFYLLFYVYNFFGWHSVNKHVTRIHFWYATWHKCFLFHNKCYFIFMQRKWYDVNSLLFCLWHAKTAEQNKICFCNSSKNVMCNYFIFQHKSIRLLPRQLLITQVFWFIAGLLMLSNNYLIL